ncbi:hypothetical protein GCM10027168_01280 [Streptomyces capparidis]
MDGGCAAPGRAAGPGDAPHRAGRWPPFRSREPHTPHTPREPPEWRKPRRWDEAGEAGGAGRGEPRKALPVMRRIIPAPCSRTQKVLPPGPPGRTASGPARRTP